MTTTVDAIYEHGKLVLPRPLSLPENSHVRVTIESDLPDLEQDSPELEAELLRAADGPFAPLREGELREIADRALREHRAKRQG